MSKEIGIPGLLRSFVSDLLKPLNGGPLGYALRCTISKSASYLNEKRKFDQGRPRSVENKSRPVNKNKKTEKISDIYKSYCSRSSSKCSTSSLYCPRPKETNAKPRYILNRP